MIEVQTSLFMAVATLRLCREVVWGVSTESTDCGVRGDEKTLELDEASQVYGRQQSSHQPASTGPVPVNRRKGFEVCESRENVPKLGRSGMPTLGSKQERAESPSEVSKQKQKNKGDAMSVFPLFVGTNQFITREAREEHFPRAKISCASLSLGLEPRTLRLKAVRSIQLRYGSFEFKRKPY